ncbi:MAG: sigma-70 family RNA polymerase sigma factor [Lachnospiraceae bacterium]|nr:sigma-70 family RNA polymerase sigma factor [Lachnospiraceae bacterium]
MTDKEFDRCLKRIRKKDKDALKEIYEEYVSFIYHVVLDIVGSKESAEDVTSEFFIKLWEKVDGYRPGGGHKGYMATIARNMAIDHIRKTRHEMPADDEEGPPLPDDTAPSPEDEAISGLSAGEALSKLKPIYRQIVIMKVLSEMTFREIASVLEMPMGTVTWNYNEAIKQLRRFGYD